MNQLINQNNQNNQNNQTIKNIINSISNNNIKIANSQIDTINTKGNTLLHYLVKYNKLNIIRYLVDNHDININVQNNKGDTPLHLASKLGHLQIVQYLFTKSVDNNIQNNDGNTPLHLAVKSNHLEIVKLLFAIIYDKNIRNNDGNTPLQFAAKYGHRDILFNILLMFSDITGVIDIDIVNNKNETLLHLAIKSHDLETIRYLETFDIDLNAKDHNSKSPLDLAFDSGDIDIIKFFVKYVDPITGNTLLHIAVTSNISKIEIFEFLVQNININLKNKNGETPLHLAVVYRNSNVIKLLLENNALILKNINGDTPLHIAVKNNNEKIVELLCNFIKIIDIKNKNGKTALNLVKNTTSPEIRNILLKHKNVNGIPSWKYFLKNNI